ncbi:MAG: bifunctional riboflavin kinase/FAD synthetase [cyanobacterium endosymbiont of Epithemia adnata isolate EadnSB Bon19]|uniref:bifunctional riboflavin kinase/FAD synthetase n=1 Tax=cyanobacterium endosymbiont of Epithemia turgida TaxID=718217 RepID=UPI0004D0F550|nr:bifunctional riboflavin kinase/FAD synthetase [cyanobacterium endosymbiont of Epithemia turgida]BAP18353.1 riboflavin biosynthesis protein [cyanobacterium endosymbiont of Epithemia turgida isolate EtSB Lake Yunoko]
MYTQSSVWVTSSTANILTPTVIALGNFDGLHLGHRNVLQPICLSSIETISSYSTVVTFTPHPQEFFTGQTRQLLTPLSEKIKLLKYLEIQQLVRLTFDRELAALSPQEFVAQILVKRLRVQQISVGEDFRFGHKRMGTAKDLSEIAASFGIPVHITSLKTYSGLKQRISSSLIRRCLAEGKVTQAKQMLGYSYSLIGTVIKGQQLGRTIGFPTANLRLPPDKLLPRQGVYAVRVKINRKETLKGLMNFGFRPTVAGKTPMVEVHILDWSGDLYQQSLTVELEEFLRPEQQFISLDKLKDQIVQDCCLARKILYQ